MKTSWSFGTNALPQYKHGTLYLLDEPLYLAIASWFIHYVVGSICCKLLRYIQLPNWFAKERDPAFSPGQKFTLREWYGSVGDVWHIYVFDPLFQWLWKRQQPYEVCVEVGFDRLREVLGDRYPEHFASEDLALADPVSPSPAMSLHDLT